MLLGRETTNTLVMKLKTVALSASFAGMEAWWVGPYAEIKT